MEKLPACARPGLPRATVQNLSQLLAAGLFVATAALAACSDDVADSGATPSPENDTSVVADAAPDAEVAADATFVNDANGVDVSGDDVSGHDVSGHDLSGVDSGGGDGIEAIDVGSCVTTDPATEVCDGLDNDCDGAIDNIAGGFCDDGDKCTLNDTCKGGVCLPGEATDCNDANTCTVDLCAKSTGACAHNATAAGSSCSDGDACTANEACQTGVCGSGEAVACDDGKVCTVDACDKTTGKCSFTSVANGSACEDGAHCTVGDTCQASQCVAGTKQDCISWYEDADKDGYGAKKGACTCDKPTGSWVTAGGDCDDDAAEISPAQKESCNGADDDCDGQIDEGACKKQLLPPGTKDVETDKPLTGDAYEVKAKMKVDAGPLGDVELTGKIVKTGKGENATYCLSGPVVLTGAPFELLGGNVEVCKDAEGNLTRKITGTIVLDGAKAAVSGTFATGKVAGLKFVADKLALLGTEATDVHLAWASGAKDVKVSAATTVIDYLAQAVTATMSGQLQPGADAVLALGIGTPAAVKMLGGVAKVAAQTGVGERTRTGKQLATRLTWHASEVSAPRASGADWQVKAERTDGAKWQLAADLDGATVASFAKLKLAGKFSEAAKACVSGATGLKPKGAKTEAIVTVCWPAKGEATAVFTATVQIEPIGKVALSGSVEDGDNKLCLSGVGEKTIKGAKGKPAPITATTCLPAASQQFEAPVLKADIEIENLGLVPADSGTWADGKLCFTASKQLALGGKKTLDLALTLCSGPLLDKIVIAVKSKLEIKPFGYVDATATIGAEPGQVCFVADVAVQYAFSASSTVKATMCLKFAPKPEFEAASFEATVAHQKLGKLALQGALQPGEGGALRLCMAAAVTTDTADFLPIKGIAILRADAQTCLEGKTFDDLELSQVVRFGPKGNAASVVIEARTILGVAGGICKTPLDLKSKCAQANAKVEAKQPNPKKTLEKRFVWMAPSCFDTAKTTKQTCKSTAGGEPGGKWVFGGHASVDVGLAPFCEKAGSGVCAWNDECDVDAGDKLCDQVWTPFATLSDKVPHQIRKLGFGELGGRIFVSLSDVTASWRAKLVFGGDEDGLTVVRVNGKPLFHLADVGVHETFSNDGNFEAKLTGSSKFSLAGAGMDQFDITTLLEGTISNKGLEFAGAVMPTSCDEQANKCTFLRVEPFKKVLGKGAFAFEVEGAKSTVSVAWDPQVDYHVKMTVESGAEFSILDNAKVAAGTKLQAVWFKQAAGCKAGGGTSSGGASSGGGSSSGGADAGSSSGGADAGSSSGGADAGSSGGGGNDANVSDTTSGGAGGDAGGGTATTGDAVDGLATDVTATGDTATDDATVGDGGAKCPPAGGSSGGGGKSGGTGKKLKKLVPSIAFAAALKKLHVKAGKFTLDLGKIEDPGGNVQIKPILFLAATATMTGFELDTDGDFSNGPELTEDIPKGITLRSHAELGPVKHLFDNVSAKLDLTIESLTTYSVSAEIQTKWDIIKPQYHVPSVHSAGLDTVYVDLAVNLSDLSLGIKLGGTANVVTIDRKGGLHPLKSLAEFELKTVSVTTVTLGGTLALTGLWVEPFYIPNVGLMDGGLKLRLLVAKPPLPMSLGFSGGGLVLKASTDAKWPKLAKDEHNNPVGVNPDGSLMKQLPKQVASMNMALLYDLAITDSGFCLAGAACLPLPHLLLKIDRQNVTAKDLADLTLKIHSALKTLAVKTKGVEIPVFDPSAGKWKKMASPWDKVVDYFFAKPPDVATGMPGSVELQRGLIYMSTHTAEALGQNWPFGIRYDVDARLTVATGPEKGKAKALRLEGQLDDAGISLSGVMDPVQPLAGIKLVADPYRRAAQLGAGQLVLPTGNDTSRWRTFEGHFTLPESGVPTGGATLFERTDKGFASGVSIRADEVAPVCAPGSVDRNGKPRDCKAKQGRIVARLRTADAKVPAAARARIVKSRWGVLPAGANTHVAVTIDPKQHRVRMFIGGAEVPVLDSARGKDGDPGTADDLARFDPPLADSKTIIGAGFSYVDDVRLWKSVRDGKQLARHLRRLPKGYHSDAHLLARFEIDYDRAELKVAGGPILNNSRLGAAKQLTGWYEGGAAPAIDPENQKLWVNLVLPIGDLVAAGFGFEGGIEIKLPEALAKLAGYSTFASAARLTFNKNGINGRLYQRDLMLVPIPTKGGFLLTGAGPNGQAGDFDDGLWMEAKFNPGLSLSSERLPSIDMSAMLAMDWDGKRYPIASSATRVGCLVKTAKGAAFSAKTCTLLDGYHFYTQTSLGSSGALKVPLGKLGNLELQGNFLVSTLDAPIRLLVQGGLKAFGRQLANTKFEIDGKGIVAESSIGLGKIHGVEFGVATKVKVSLDWSPARMCAAGQTKVAIPLLATFDGSVSACFGHNPTASFSGTAKKGVLLNMPLKDMVVALSEDKGLLIKNAGMDVGGLLKAQFTGWYKDGLHYDIDSSGSTDNALLHMSHKLRMVADGLKGQALLQVDLNKEPKDSKRIVVGSLKGQLGYDAKKLYFMYDMAGDAVVQPLGLVLGQSKARLYSKSGLPVLSASGMANLGFSKVTVTGLIDTKDNKYRFDGQLKPQALQKILSVQGKLVMDNQSKEPFLFTGKLSGLGGSTDVKALMKAEGGVPVGVKLEGNTSLAVPTPSGSVKLANSKLWYEWSKAGHKAGASGWMKLPKNSASMTASIASDGNYTFVGKAPVVFVGYTLGESEVRFGKSEGISIKGSWYSPFKGSFEGTLSQYGNIFIGSKLSIGGDKLKLGGDWTYHGCWESGKDRAKWEQGCYNQWSGGTRWQGASHFKLTPVTTLTFSSDVKTSGTKLVGLNLTGTGTISLPLGFTLGSSKWWFVSNDPPRVCWEGTFLGQKTKYECLAAPGPWKIVTGAAVDMTWLASGLPNVNGYVGLEWTGSTMSATSDIAFKFLGFSYKGTSTINAFGKITRFKAESYVPLHIVYDVIPTFTLGKPKWCKKCCCTKKIIKKICIDGFCGGKPVSVSWNPKTVNIAGKTILDIDNNNISHKWCGTEDWGIIKVKGKCAGISASKTINLCASPFNLPLNFSFKDPVIHHSFGYNACSVKLP